MTVVVHGKVISTSGKLKDGLALNHIHLKKFRGISDLAYAPEVGQHFPDILGTEHGIKNTQRGKKEERRGTKAWRWKEEGNTTK